MKSHSRVAAARNQGPIGIDKTLAGVLFKTTADVVGSKALKAMVSN
jgi:hypothetical protein